MKMLRTKRLGDLRLECRADGARTYVPTPTVSAARHTAAALRSSHPRALGLGHDHICADLARTSKSNFPPRADCIRVFSQPGALISVTVFLSSTGSRSGRGSTSNKPCSVSVTGGVKVRSGQRNP